MTKRVGGALTLIVLGICLTIAMRGSLPIFLDAKSVLFVVGVTAGGTLLYAPFAATKDAFSSWLGDGPLEESSASNAARVFQQMGHSATAAGLLGTVVGLVLMLQNMEDPSAIGPAMSVGLLTIFYGVVLGQVLLRGMAANCLNRGGITHSPRHRRGTTSLALLLASTFILLFTFNVMLLAMANFEPCESDFNDAEPHSETIIEPQTQETE